MKILHSVHPQDFKNYDTSLIRERFLLEDLAVKGNINLRYTHYDRMIVGLALPLAQALKLKNHPDLRSDFFLERREMGVINVGGEGTVTADGQTYHLGKLDCLYLGRGTREVEFSALEGHDAPVYYILSALSHAAYPTRLLKKEEANGGEMGSVETANRRTIYRYIHKEGIQSSQLVMGLTILHKGSVWNTMPAHRHDRRMEAYFYFDIPENQRVFHYMGEPEETRHILIKNHEAVISPPWSIHSGSGTSNYSFIWGMAGENLEYTDMDPVPVEGIQ